MEKEASKNLINARALKTKKMAKVFQFVPFIKCLILNGSLAEGKSKRSSDIDFLIIAKTNRIFTVRFFTGVIGAALGVKRSSRENTNHAGKFCFNYYLTEDFLEIPHDREEEVNLYCAKNYSASILIWGDRQIFNEYYKVNYAWMEKYLHTSKFKFADGFPLKDNFVSKQFPVNNIRGRQIGRRWEKVLSGKFGDWLELQTKRFQIFLIERDKRTWSYPEYIVYNDRELRFHPPKNKTM